MPRKPKKQEPTSWVVKMRCVVIKEVVAEDCTEEEARNNPWEFCHDETEIEQTDWEVLHVEPNE